MDRLHEVIVAAQQPPVAMISSSPDPSITTGLWVFGYGSLCWHPGFEYHRSLTGYIEGFSRKFWQGNTTHRGTEGQPGRVATLVEESSAKVWGRAFEVKGEAALPYLAKRECQLGGYVTKFVTFYPRRPCGEGNEIFPTQPFTALLYVATPNNSLWLGEAPLQEIAKQIVSCRGQTGHNVEYLLKLADYMRSYAPEADDDHLFTLETLVRSLVREQRLCLQTLMGGSISYSGECTVSHRKLSKEEIAGQVEFAVSSEDESESPQEPRRESFQFSSRMLPSKLRCLNI